MFKSIYLVNNPYIEHLSCHLLISIQTLIFQPEFSTQTGSYITLGWPVVCLHKSSLESVIVNLKREIELIQSLFSKSSLCKMKTVEVTGNLCIFSVIFLLLGYHKETCCLPFYRFMFRFVSLYSVSFRAFVSFPFHGCAVTQHKVVTAPRHLPVQDGNCRAGYSFPLGNFSLVSCAGSLRRVEECFKGMKILVF